MRLKSLHDHTRHTATAIVCIAVLTGCTPDSGGEGPGAGDDTGKGKTARLASLSRVEGIPESGVELGLGWSTRQGRLVYNRCIEFAPVQETGQSIALGLHEVSDTSDVMNSLDVSTSVSVKGMFGASGSAKASFSKQSKVSSTSTSLLLRATVTNGVLFVGPRRGPDAARRSYPAFGSDGVEPAPARGWRDWEKHWKSQGVSEHIRLTSFAKELTLSEFKRHCGDSFVSAIHSGAEILSIISFSASSQQTKQRVAASVKASYGMVSGSASANKANEAARASTNLDVTYMQIGGGGESSTIPIDRAGLETKLKGLPKEAEFNPKFHSMIVTPYTQLADWNKGAIPADGQADDETLSELYWFLSSLYEDIEDIQSNPGDFVIRKDAPSLSDFQDQVLTLRENIYRVVAAEGASATPALVELPEPDKPLVYSFGKLVELDLSKFDTGVRKQTTLEPGKSDAGATKQGAEPQMSFSWYKAFAEHIRTQLPNPNILRLMLPLPKGAACLASDANNKCTKSLKEADYAKAAVDWYIRPQATRVCQIDPTDNECMSNAEMKALLDKV